MKVVVASILAVIWIYIMTVYFIQWTHSNFVK